MACHMGGWRLGSVVLASVVLAFLLSAPATAAITVVSGSVDPTWDSSDPWNISGNLTVGLTGNGELLIDAGSRVVDINGYIAAIAGATASVTVKDVNSTWENSGVLSVGELGNGALTISNGGAATSTGGALVGYTSADSVGSVTVTDANSLWTVGNTLRVGGSGSGSLSILAGGRVDANTVIVTSGTSETSQLTVSGSGSLLQAVRYMSIRSGGRMDVNDGARVTSYDGNINGIVHIDGAGSAWISDSGLTMGGDVDLTISNGGHVSGNGCVIQPSDGQTVSVTVTGEDSLWESQSYFVTGCEGNISLLISDGGRVSTHDAAIQAFPGGTAVVTVTGPNSLWTNTGTLTVGDYYYHGPLAVYHPAQSGVVVVSDGGRVETGDMMVWDEGILAGNGTLKATQITNYGTIRPGGSIGTLTIEGDLTMDSNAVLEAEIDNSGHSDELAVTGNVQVTHGTVKVISTEAITQPQQYTIIDANNVTGTFDGVNTAQLDTGAMIGIASLGYEPNAVILDVTPTAFNDPVLAPTRNESRVGSALQQMASGGGNTITAAVAGLSTYADVRHAYDQLSGQTQAPLSTVVASGMERHIAVVSNRLHRAAGPFGTDTGALSGHGKDLPAMTGPQSSFGTSSDFGMGGSTLFAVGSGTPYLSDQPWGVWGKGYGVRGSRSTTDEFPGYIYTNYGTTFGLDYRVTDQFLCGLLGGFSEGGIDPRDSRDSSDISAGYYGLYASFETRQWYLDSIFSYGDLDFQTRRYVDVVHDRLDGDFGGNAISGYLEGGFVLPLEKAWLLQPLAGFQYTQVETDEYTESGGESRLGFDSNRFESYKSSLGAREIGLLYKEADGSQGTVELRGRWLHEFGDRQSSLNAHFVSDPTLGFSVVDAPAGRDSAVLGVGLDIWFGKALRTFFDYDWEGGRDLSVNLVSLGLQYRW
jgi:T5SS/PEP-CTERM-associated repeat protein